MLTGENGILTQSKKAKDETKEARKKEEDVIENYEQYIEGATNGATLIEVTGKETTNTTVYDALGNKVEIPAGFKVVNPGSNVEDGIVIEDVANEETKGSQFVWIPVGENIKKKDGTVFDIILRRYVFNEDGTINEELSKTDPMEELRQYTITDQSFFQEALKNSETKNVHAKDIEMFLEKVSKTGGYYIGRYEARTNNLRTEKTDDDKLTQLTVKSDDYVYTYVTQIQAANLSRNMYSSSNFESDLVNSYAWMGAILFAQKCDDRENKEKPYSMQDSINKNELVTKGTNNLDIEDIICNIYDMASNYIEWTTETFSNDNDDKPCSCVGGIYNNNAYTSKRYFNSETYTENDVSFRPIIYF